MGSSVSVCGEDFKEASCYFDREGCSTASPTLITRVAHSHTPLRVRGDSARWFTTARAGRAAQHLFRPIYAHIPKCKK